MYDEIHKKTKNVINAIVANKKVPITAYNPTLLVSKLENYTGHKPTIEATTALLGYLRDVKTITSQYGAAAGYDWNVKFNYLFLGNPEVEPSTLLLQLKTNLDGFNAEQAEKKAQAATVSGDVATTQPANKPA
jgi:hypothetical protein